MVECVNLRATFLSPASSTKRDLGITKHLWLEGTTVGRLVQPPCLSRVMPEHRTASGWFLNISREGHSTTSPGKKCCSARSLKKRIGLCFRSRTRQTKSPASSARPKVLLIRPPVPGRPARAPSASAPSALRCSASPWPPPPPRGPRCTRSLTSSLTWTGSCWVRSLSPSPLRGRAPGCGGFRRPPGPARLPGQRGAVAGGEQPLSLPFPLRFPRPERPSLWLLIRGLPAPGERPERPGRRC